MNDKKKMKWLLTALLLLVTVSVWEGMLLYKSYGSSCFVKEKLISQKMGKHIAVESSADARKSLEGAHAEQNLVIPEKGLVPNHETAVKIAEAIWLPIYGEKIYDEQPFNTALLDDSIWIVSGTLPENNDGGTVYLKMKKSDGEILFVTHYK